MANIADLTSETFDDNAELRRELTRMLNELNRDVNATVDVTLGKKVALVWFNDKTTPLPNGYFMADGQNGTDDFRPYFTADYYFIQKVR